MPVIFMTGHCDIPMYVKAMKAETIDFLSKPFRDQDFLDSIGEALERDTIRSQSEGEICVMAQRYETLKSSELQATVQHAFDIRHYRPNVRR